MLKITEKDFPKSGVFDYWDLLNQLVTEELISLRNKRYQDFQRIRKTEEEFFRKIYGNKVKEIPLTSENVSGNPFIEITDKKFVLVWFSNADSGGYDSTDYVEIFDNPQEYFKRFKLTKEK